MNKIATLFLALSLTGCSLFDFGAKVDVKIYKHIESGNLIYCASGDLDNSDLHEYQGEGKIDEDKAEHC